MVDCQFSRCLLAGLVIGVTLALAPATATATAPPDRLGQAEDDFAAFLAEEFPGDEVSPGPHCSLSDDGGTATCEALVDGAGVRYVSAYSGALEEYSGWETPERFVAEEAAVVAFDAWLVSTYTDTFGEDPEGICELTEESLTAGGCITFGDGFLTATFVVSDSGDYEWTTDFLDPANVDTALGDAVAACLSMDDESGEPYDQDDFELFDAGHSVFLNDSYHDSSRCVMEQLNWADWVSEMIARTDGDLILWTTITFDGYTISWQAGEVLIYDETVNGA